jgi:hypothetical protein
MSTNEIGAKLIELCEKGESLKAIDSLYDEKIVSVEAQGSDEVPARMEGIEAIQGKSAWWLDNHDVHSTKAAGPYCGQDENRFAVFFEMDVTFKPTGERQTLKEVGLYTVSNNKIVHEEFWG